LVKRLQNIIFFLILGCSGKIMAQPTVLGTNAANYPTYTTNALNNFGKLKQFRVQAITIDSLPAANSINKLYRYEYQI